jgi:biopolymer transport protein ExbB
MTFILFTTAINKMQITNTSQVDNLLDLLMKGGVIMIPIFLLSLISIYIFIERYIYIRKAVKIDPSMVTTIIREIKDKQPEKALAYAQMNKASAGKIFSIGLSRIGKPSKDIDDFMESATNLEIAQMEKDTGYLGIIAGIAPMLGFIGTISGVIKIFYNISLADNISIGIIAGGLYQKMICSGTGLIVGVIAYCGYHYLNMMIDSFSTKLQRQVLEFTKVI